MFDFLTKKSAAKKVTGDVCAGGMSDKDIFDFISVSAHQLKTPLSAVKWSLELIKKGEVKTDEEYRILYDKMYESTIHALRLIDAMLSAYKLETQSAVFDYELGDDVGDLLMKEIDEVRPLAQNKKILIEMNIPSLSITDLYIDHAKIQDVFQVLLENAVRYSQPGGRIRVSMKTGADGIFFEFSDNGIGIPKSNQDKIFQKFYRAPTAIASEHRGNGLGLFIAKNIVEKHSGKIWFESEENHGTSFFVTLPFGPKK
jgi:signal transduction histidine kinase